MPTETAKPRLIDANALLKEWRKDSEDEMFHALRAGLAYAIDTVESAPTVETTDDVLARLPDDKYVLEFGKGIAKIYSKWDCFKEGKGKTIIEAVKSLEESLNRK